jgi:hypothetical protein
VLKENLILIRTDIKNLKQTDYYSLILFALYKFNEIPEYSSLSELAYTLDKDNLLNLCEMFGGQTIRIPTIHELESLIYSLLLYQYVKIDGMEYKKALELIGHESCDLRAVKTQYLQLSKVLDNYSFKHRESIK